MGEGGQLLNDLWVLRADRITAMLWQKVVTDGPPPSIRACHGAVDSLSCLYIVGGRTEAFGAASAQVYALDTNALAPLPAMDGAFDDSTAPPTSNNAPAPPAAGDRQGSAGTRRKVSSQSGGISATPGTESSS